MFKKLVGIVVCMLMFSTIAIPNISSIKINVEELKSETNIKKESAYIPGDYLLDTVWRQGGLYNFYCPDNTSSGQKTILGCWSVAIAQIIKNKLPYYSLQSEGNVNYWCKFNFINPQHIVEDLDATSYDWTNMTYELTGASTPAELENVRRILYDTAIVIQKDFGTSKYKTVIGEPPDVSQLINNLTLHFSAINGYTAWIADPMSEDIVTEEINHSRPIMFYMNGHAVVLDGYKYENVGGNPEFYVHLNYGWGPNSPDPIDDAWYPYWEPFPGGYDQRYGLLIRYNPSVAKIDGDECLPVDGIGNYMVETVFDTDPPLFYTFKWGDGDSEVLGPYDVGRPCSASHSWSSPGIYSLMVQVKNNMGCESEPTEMFKVHVTRFSFLLPLIQRLIDLKDRFPRLEPFINIILSVLCR